MAAVVLVALLALVASAGAQTCTKTPTFAGAATSFSYCKTLKALSTDVTATANFAWTAKGNTINAIVTCSGLTANGGCAFGFSPNGKMQGSNAVIGYANPANPAQSKVMFYTLGNHKNVKPINGNSGTVMRLTSKAAVQIVSPTSVSIRFTAQTRVPLKNLFQTWGFLRPAASYANGVVGGHLKGAHGAAKSNLVAGQ